MQANNEKSITTALTIPETFGREVQEMVINSLQEIQGVSEVTVDPEEKKVEVTFDPTIASRGQFQNLITELKKNMNTGFDRH